MTECEQVFGSPEIAIDRITTAIAGFEKSLATPGAPSDLWLAGDEEALSEAVDVMARVQLGKELTTEDTALMVAFLKTLTGEQPAFGLPILPPSTDATVRPAPFE